MLLAQEHKELKEHKEHKELREVRVLKEHKELVELTEHKEQLEHKERKDCKELKEHKEVKEHKELKEQPVEVVTLHVQKEYVLQMLVEIQEGTLGPIQTCIFPNQIPGSQLLVRLTHWFIRFLDTIALNF